MKKRVLSLLLTVALVTSLGFGVSAKENGGNKQEAGINAGVVQESNTLDTRDVKVFSKDESGRVFISGKLSGRNTPNSINALMRLDENKNALGLQKVYGSFNAIGEEKDNLGFTHIKFQQTLNGLPIEGKTLAVHYNRDGIVSTINGTVENKISTIKTLGNSNLTKEEAINIAVTQLSFTKLKEQPTANKIVFIKDNNAYEVYKVNVRYNEPTIGEWNVYVEAHSGNVINKEDRMRYDGAVTGTGTPVVGSTKPLNLYQSGTSYQMKDTTKAMTGQILTYTANHTTTEQLQLVSNTSTTFNTEDFKAGVSAHYFAGVVYDFYKNLFNRNSINNNGMSIISTVHYDNAWNNAGWGSGQMVYGDGDGSQFTYLSGDLDVVAHEMTHGVDEYTADLVYQDQPGALNESMSDVLGVLIETYDKYDVRNGGTWAFNAADWVVGDDITTPNTPGDALRSLADPTLYGDPAHMDNYLNTTSDYGGVHTNSGIPNKAGFLVAQAIGCEKTARIYYRAMATYMNTSTNFAAARTALVQAATDLYGASGAEVTAVNNAYDAIGVGGSTPPPTDPYEPNGTTAQAYQISTGTTYNSYISSASDVDYYTFATTQSGTITVNLSNLPKDYDLYLLNSSGTQVAKSENGSTTAETITYSGAAGTYYVKVAGYNGAYSTTTKYALKADFSGSTPPPSGDTYEPNGTTAEAYGINTGTTYNSYIYTSTDVDYYKFSTTQSGTITVNLSNLPGDYDLYLYNSSGTQVGSSASGSTTAEKITYTGAAGTYYVKVIGYSGAYSTATQYSLKVDFTASTGDPYEPNDTTAQAYSIASGTAYNSYIYTSTDVDYYKFTVGSSKSITITLTNLPKDYDIYLYNSSGTQVAKSILGGTSSETITYTAAAGTYYVKVVGYSGAYSTTTQYALKATY